MFFAHHIYFLAGLYFFLLWSIFFYVCKQHRKRMLYISFGLMIFGPLVQQMHLIDWWHPNFIFNTFIKIEDILFSFSVAGIISAIHSILRSNKKEENIKTMSFTYKITGVTFIFFLLFGLFYFGNLSSFWSSIIAFITAFLLVIYNKPSSLRPIILTGVMMVILAFPGYLLGVYLNPNVFQQEWFLNKLSGITLYTIPIEELVWFFFSGMCTAAFCELWEDKKTLN